MAGSSVVVFDVGKTNAKLSLWDADGTLLARRTRSNAVIHGARYLCLDVEGLERWLSATLREFAGQANVGCIVPVCHGAAAVLIHRGQLFAPPMDYEDDAAPAEREAYLASRDAYGLTGSPALPHGLNLGLQLDRLERLTGPWPEGLHILLWPQYWAWRLSGVMASEATSLGCHTDLWHPQKRGFSDLAVRRGWSERFPSLRHAGDTLGNLSAEWVSNTGLPKGCQVLCGLHDSNAALLAARGHPEVAGRGVSVVSTGTWFVAMHVPPKPADIDLTRLDERLDCLLNVDIENNPVPSARFMGGREVELIAGDQAAQISTSLDAGRLAALLAEDSMALPSFAPGVGPFPEAKSRWINRPAAESDRQVIACLYLALMTDACLNLVGSRESIIIEGRFAQWPVFVRALAHLRPRQAHFTSPGGDGIAAGALRLAGRGQTPQGSLNRVTPLDVELDAFARRWRAHADG